MTRRDFKSPKRPIKWMEAIIEAVSLLPALILMAKALGWW